jgi:hypothetical protein
VIETQCPGTPPNPASNPTGAVTAPPPLRFIFKLEVTPMERFSFQTAIHGSGGVSKVIHGKDILDRNIAVKVLSPLLDA